jgi:sulfite reductase alpha subunit-like flavoprotein
MQTVLLAREFSRLVAWDGHSKADVDRHFGDVRDTLQTLKFLERNIDITNIFQSVVLATLKSSKNKALTKAYASILVRRQNQSHPLARRKYRTGKSN